MKCQMVCKLRLHDSSKDGLNRQKWTTLIYENSGRFQVEVGDTRSSWELPGRAGSSQVELGGPRSSWEVPGRAGGSQLECFGSKMLIFHLFSKGLGVEML